VRTWRGLRPQATQSHGSNTDETRMKDEEFEQEQTEKTEENADSLFPLLSPVRWSVILFYGVDTADINEGISPRWGFFETLNTPSQGDQPIGRCPALGCRIAPRWG
jgi:hypothetical protein